MPIHLSATRREFLIAAGAGLVAWPLRGLANDVAPDVVYLLNDTHIGEKHPPDSPVPSHLRQVIDELLALEQRPACVLINGDLALKDGQRGDYEHFARLIQPLQSAKIDLHLTLGNHDHRERFYEILKEQRPEMPPVESRHISVVETRFVNFVLLDSLQETMVTRGVIGGEQLHWLTQALDQGPDKPALVVAHHNPRLGGDPLHFPGGLVDSTELWEVLAPRRHVKAYVHGHIHHRSFAEHDGIHIINTPATSYVGNPELSTTGWTVAKFDAAGVTLTTRTNLAEHPWNEATKRLEWRV